MNDLMAGITLFLLCVFPAALVTGWRRLRNLDRLAATEQQLAACRLELQNTLRECRRYHHALDLAVERVTRLERRQRRERLVSRHWLARTVAARNVSKN